jgi:hypothetical protein
MVYHIQEESEDEVMEIVEVQNDEVEPVDQNPEHDNVIEQPIEELVEQYGQDIINYVQDLPIYLDEEIEESLQYLRNIANRYFSAEEQMFIHSIFQPFCRDIMVKMLSDLFSLLHEIVDPLRRIVIMYMLFYIINKTLPRYRLTSRAKIYSITLIKIIELRNEHEINFEEFTIFGNPNLPTIETILESWEE